jgi:tetratricopeptide (TPR) repeat protein
MFQISAAISEILRTYRYLSLLLAFHRVRALSALTKFMVLIFPQTCLNFPRPIFPIGINSALPDVVKGEFVLLDHFNQKVRSRLLKPKDCLVVIAFLLSSPAHSQTKVQSLISQQGETIHIEFSGLNEWDYQLKKSDLGKNQFKYELLVPAVADSDISEIRAFKHPLIEKIEVNPKNVDGKTLISIQPKYTSLEAFDYQTEKPSRLIVDLYMATPEKRKTNDKQSTLSKAKESTKLNSKSSKTIAESKNGVPVNDDEDEAKPLRGPATADFLSLDDKGMPISTVDVGDLSQLKKVSNQPIGSVFDGADPNFDRFNIKDYEIKEESIIRSQEKVYIDFPMLKVPSPYLEILSSRKPLYELNAEDSEENKQARLLLTLFENKRFNVFLKTLEWFSQKYPLSKYDEMLQFMKADAQFAQWEEKRNAEDFDQAILSYRRAIEKYPQSPLMERTMMLIGFSTLDRGDYLSTLRLFLTHIQKRPQSPNRDIAKFALAEAFQKIRRFDEASQIYKELEKEAVSDKDRIQAAYRLGDVAFDRKDFRQAVQTYQEALKKYPQGRTDYPNAIYNQAAALFNLKEYRNSLDQYRDFIKNYSAHPEAGFAMTRVGEILDILGAKPERVLGVYLETFFRYGNAPSSVVARLRMLSERMDKMKPKEVEKAVQDIQKLAADSKLPKMDQFATLMISEGYNRRADFPQAIDLLINFYQANPTTVDTALFKSRIEKNINEMIKSQVEQGHFIKALQTHNQYADSWLKGSKRIDTLYFIGDAYEQGGALSEAEKIYTETLNKISALKGTQSAKERNIFEKLPTEDQVFLRLAAVQNQRSDYAAAMNSIKEVKDPGKLSDREQIERVQIIAHLLDKKGDTETAVRYITELVKEWSGIPQLVADPYLDLARLELKQNRTDEAIRSLKKIDTLMKDSGKVPEETHFRALKLLADIHLDKKDLSQAMPYLENLLDLFESKKPLSSYRYRLGKIFFDKGEIKKAEDVWSTLKGSDSTVWSKLAAENLKESQWKDEYNKYIKRIPAMSADSNESERKNQ